VEALEDRTLPSFAAPAVFDLGSAVKAVAVGHLLGASAPVDVVTADTDGTVKVLVGKGDGTFQNPENITLGTTPKGLAVGDLLGNGRDDIVVANTNGTVTVLLSNGDGTFASPESVDVGGFINGVAVGDLLGNGRQDIVTANTNSTVSALLTNADGTFTSPVITAVNTGVIGVATGDFNGDGKADLALASVAGVTVLKGNGDGSFSPLTTISLGVDQYTGEPIAADAVAVADLRTSGKLDLVVKANSALQVVLGNGDGTFAALSAPFDTVQSFVVGDFNGDGKPDIVSIDNPGFFFTAPTARLLVGNGDGTFRFGSMFNTGVFDSSLAAGDFAGTGHADLVLAQSFQHLLTILPSNGDGTLATAPTVVPGDFLSPAATGVFTASGRQDLVLSGVKGDGTGIVRVMFSNGDGTFTTGPTLTVGANTTPDGVVVGDFTGNGHQDIAVTSTGAIHIFLGNGNGTFQDPLTVQDSDFHNLLGPIVVGDFNGDGNLDIAVRTLVFPSHPNDPELSLLTVFLGNGDGTFTKSADYTVGVGAAGTLVAADLRGNGTLDLVTTAGDPTLGTGVVKVLFGMGDGTFQDPVTVFTGDRSIGLAVGDFTGHGRNDLLVTKFDGTVNVLANNGDGTFGSPIVSQVGSFLGSPTVADFFDDGHLSLATTTQNGVVTVLRGNGDGTFQAPVDYLVGAGSHPLVVGDFNGDGKPDLAVGNTFPAGNGRAFTVSILLNTSPAPSTADPVATNISLAADLGSTVFGQRVTLTATVTAASGTPAGTVTFFDGDKPLGEVAVDGNGQAALVLPLGVGVHSLTARFAGIAPFTGSTAAAISETVAKANTMTSLSAEIICENPDGSTRVAFTADVTAVAPGAGVPSGTVTLRDGDRVLGTASVDANGQAFFDLDVPPAAMHSWATYNGDGNFEASTSNPLALTL
jgi:hypothetical protein